MEFELRPKSMIGLHALFAAIGLCFGRTALNQNEHIILRVFFGVFFVMGLWCLLLLLKDVLVWLVIKTFHAESILAEITEVSRGPIRFTSEKTGKVTCIYKVTCRKDGRFYKGKTMKFLDYKSIGRTVPVLVSCKIPQIYLIDFAQTYPPEEMSQPPVKSAKAAETEETSDYPPVRKPCFKWLYRSPALWLLLFSLPCLAFGLIVIEDFSESWPLLLFVLGGLVMMFFAAKKIVRYVATFVLGDRLNAKVVSVNRLKNGRYAVILCWGCHNFSAKSDYIGRALIGKRINVYVSRRNPDVYEVDL